MGDCPRRVRKMAEEPLKECSWTMHAMTPVHATTELLDAMTHHAKAFEGKEIKLDRIAEGEKAAGLAISRLEEEIYGAPMIDALLFRLPFVQYSLSATLQITRKRGSFQ